MSNIATSVGSVTRQVSDRVRDGRAAKEVVLSRSFTTDVTDLWSAVADPDRLSRWFLPVVGEFRPGGDYQLKGSARGTVEACEPGRRLAVTWEFGGDCSWIEVGLVPDTPASTTLKLEQVLLLDPKRWAQYGPTAVGIGWDCTLLALGRHLATGESIDADASEAWLSTVEGDAFVRSSADGWRLASIAAGDAAAAADRAAAEGWAFYTGRDKAGFV